MRRRAEQATAKRLASWSEAQPSDFEPGLRSAAPEQQ